MLGDILIAALGDISIAKLGDSNENEISLTGVSPQIRDERKKRGVWSINQRRGFRNPNTNSICWGCGGVKLPEFFHYWGEKKRGGGELFLCFF